MELRLDTVGDEIIDVCIAGDGGSWADLIAEDSAERWSISNLPGKLDSLPHQCHIGRVGQASGIESRGIEGVISCDVQSSLAEGVLEGELDGDRLGAAPGISGNKQQKLDLAKRAQQEIVGICEIECFVTFDNTRILAGELGYGVIKKAENSLLKRRGIIGGTHELRAVGIESRRVDEGKEWRGLSVGNAVGSTVSQLGAPCCRGSAPDDTGTLKGDEYMHHDE